MSIETVRIKDLEEVSVNDIERMWIPVDSATPDSTNKVKLSAFAAYVGGISDGKYIPLAGSSSITGSLVPSVANAALGSGSHKWLSLFAGGVHASDLLAIPQAAPSDPDPLESYLYCNTSGNYAETPSGGVANIYDLTIRRGSVSAGTYNLGEQAADINLSSLFSGYATESWVSSNFNNYTLPTASSSTKGGIKVGSSLSISNEVLNVLSGSIASNNTGYVTGGDIYSYINAIMSSSMKNIGESSTPITNGGSETPTINGSAYTPNVNDVVFYNSKEFVWTSLSKWRELGDESSFALKTTSISAGTGLTGGGTLSEDRTISLSTETQTSLGKADTAYQKPSGGIPDSDLADAYLKLSGNSVATKITGDVYMTRGKYLKMVESNGTDSVNLLGISSSGAWFTLGNSSYRAEINSNNSNILHVKNGVSYAVYDESNLTKSVLTTLLESSNGYYVKKAGDTMTGDLTFDASSAAKEIKFGYASSGSGSAVKMGNDGKLYFGADQLTNNKDTYLYGGNISISWHREAIAGGNVAVLCSGNNFAPSKNNSIYLGHGSYRWATVYGVNFDASGTLSVTGVSTLSGGAKVSTMLAIPQSAPSTSASWYSANDAYLYADTSGNYSESAGGGVANVYPLTITINGTSTVYNPGSAAQTVSFGVPTSAQISAWNAKYDKPSTGIPKTDLASAVQTSLGKADSALQSVAFSDLTTHPTTISGYGITDAKIETPSGTTNKKITLGSNNFTIYSWALASSKPSYAFSDLTAHPTTISGYGITDAKIETPSGTSNRKITLGSNNFTIYAWALASSKPSYTLDDVADGSTRKLANYLPLAGGTLTGPLIVASTSAGNFNEGIRLTRASNSWTGITFGSTGTSGMATDGWFAATNPSKQFIIAAGDSAATSGLCLNKAGDAKWRDNVILHAGNYSSYALPLSGGTLSHTNTSTQVLKLSTTNALSTTLNFDTGGSATGRIEAYKSDYSYGVVIQNLAATGTPYVNIASDGKFKYNNTYEFYHTNNLTISTLGGVPKKDGVRFYPYIGTNSSASFGAQWFKVTLSHNGQAAGANRWYMLSMDLVINSAYSTTSPQSAIKGTVHLQYYFYYNNSAGTYAAGIVKGMFTGMNYEHLQIKYDPSNPAIFYVKTNGGANIYNTLSIENMMANDSSANIDYSTTTIETIAEANIPSSASTVVPIDSYLPLTGGTVSGELYVAGALAVPTNAPRNQDASKTYIYIGTTGSYIQ